MQQKVSPAVIGGVLVVLLALGVFFYMRSANSGSARQLPPAGDTFKPGYSGGNSPARPAPGAAATAK